MVAEKGPYSTWDSLLDACDQAEARMTEQDWLEAFAAHPRIGERKMAASQSARWSGEEQSRVLKGAQDLLGQILEGNKRYEEKFEIVFLISAAGKSPQEILAALSQRLENSRAVELINACNEQKKITRLRLEKWLCQISP